MDHKTLIRDAMRTAGVTQAELGARLGIRQQAISNYLNRDDMLFSTFAGIMDALGYEVTITRRDDNES